MIENVEGDLLLATENIIGHQVNCKGVMGAGVAFQIRETYQQACIDYLTYCKTKSSKDLLGDCQLVKINETKYIANLFGQENFGYNGLFTNYKALGKSLTTLENFASRHLLSVALPYKIGSDRGGGDWDIVYKIIDRVFFNYEVALYKF